MAADIFCIDFLLFAADRDNFEYEFVAVVGSADDMCAVGRLQPEAFACTACILNRVFAVVVALKYV